MVTYTEIKKDIDYARCSKCGHNATSKDFRLMHITEIVEKGAIKRKKTFDGILRCPMCGTENPSVYPETITMYVPENRGL